MWSRVEKWYTINNCVYECVRAKKEKREQRKWAKQASKMKKIWKAVHTGKVFAFKIARVVLAKQMLNWHRRPSWLCIPCIKIMWSLKRLRKHTHTYKYSVLWVHYFWLSYSKRYDWRSKCHSSGSFCFFDLFAHISFYAIYYYLNGKECRFVIHSTRTRTRSDSHFRGNFSYDKYCFKVRVIKWAFTDSWQKKQRQQ